MSPKKNQNPSKIKNESNQPLPDAMADCVLPEELIMSSILTRLPVKSLLRFKSVCKPWLKLFATPNFIKSHCHQFSSHSENQNFMIYSLSSGLNAHTMSLFRIESHEKKATYLNHPYPEILDVMDFVGCCNGLVCLVNPALAAVVLWNPAMQLCKLVRLPSKRSKFVSFGFGYDIEEEDDFKVVRIEFSRGERMEVDIDVYTVKSSSWKTIKVGLQFRLMSATNDAIVGGIPYWIAKDDSGESQIVWFDMKKMVCKMVPYLDLELGEEMKALPLMDWKGSVATILCKNGCFHVLVFDKDAEMWNMVRNLGPIGLNVRRCLQCSKSGKIIGMCFDGKLFVFDPKSRGVKVFELEKAPFRHSFQVHEYNESLVLIEGMKPVVVGVLKWRDPREVFLLRFMNIARIWQ